LASTFASLIILESRSVECEKMNDKQKEPNKPECLSLARLSDLMKFNTSAYWTYT